MDKPLYDEMVATDGWDGEIVFSCRGLKYDLLPNPTFGCYPSDCGRTPAALFFTAKTVSLLTQTSPDDAAVAVEDNLDTISSIVEHHMPESKEAGAANACILEFRCLHSRFYFGTVSAGASATTAAATTDDTKVFEALPRILQVYSPGISYDRVVPLSLADGLAMTDQDFPSVTHDFSWTPPPPSEAPPSSRRNHQQHHSSSSVNRSLNNTMTSATDNNNTDGSPASPHSATSNRMNNSLENSDGAGESDNDEDGSSSDDSFGYSNVMRGGGTSHHAFHGRRLNMAEEAAMILEKQLSQLQVYEAEDRCDLVMEQMNGFFELACALQRNAERTMKAQCDARHTVNVTTLDSRHSLATYGGEDGISFPIPPSAREQPANETVKGFLDELERSVRVRLGQYLVAGAGPKILAQRQQAEAAALYRSLSDQLERLKAQNSALAVHLAQERRNTEDLEQELQRAHNEATQAKAREQAVISRMRRREAEWSSQASGQTLTMNDRGDDEE